MTSPETYGRNANGALLMSPFDHVRAQLARQKWAVDTHSEGALYNIYTRDCTLILKQDGKDEVARVRGREAIIAIMAKGWKANLDWRPGSMIHHIGTLLIEPAPEGLIRCWSYATYVHLTAAGATEIHGYGKYHDLWAEEDAMWRLQEREVHIFGLKLGGAD
jgi:hypothetical protein